jgi:L-threonylcarbamoyladenylate synthase
VSQKPVDPDASGIRVASDALLRGELVVLPTETLYGIFADATVPAGLAALRALRSAAGVAPDSLLTWHAMSPALPASLHAVQRHIVDALLPGPVRLLCECSTQEAAAWREQHAAVPAGVVDGPLENDPSARVIAIRVPSDATFRAVASHTRVLVGERVGLAGLGDGSRLPAGATTLARSAGIAHVIDTGPTSFGQPSSTIRLTRSGWYKVESTGAWSERTLRSKFESQILFLCTGNTCRSPMAEAIARHYLAKPGATQKPVRVGSAGVATGDGMPMTHEAVEALERMRIDAGRHRSRALTREMVEDATFIFAMTQSHADRAIELVPSARSKIVTLDPSGRDIADPIGGPLATYVQTAEAIAGFIRTRLTDAGMLVVPRKKPILEPG